MKDEVINAITSSDLARDSAGVTRRAAFQIGGLAGFAMLMTACAPGTSPGPTPGGGGGTPIAGGSVTWAVNSDPVSLAPFGMTNTSGLFPKNLIYESLVNWDDEMNVLPALAETWEVPDEKTYIFHLRKGVKFHGGQELKAADVKYSFESQAEPPPPGSVNLQYPKIGSIEIVDDYTVKFVMSQADGTVIGYCGALTYSFITPANMYDNLDPNNQTNGTGPFMLDKFTPNDSVTLKKNPDYWDSGLPYLDDITLKVLTDIQPVVTGITAGSLDGGFVNADTAVSLESNPNVTMQKKPAVAFRELEWVIKGDVPWADVRVRQAVNFAINRDKIIANVYAGEAEYSSKIPPSYGDWGIPVSELKADYEKFSLDKAKALMKDAGYESGFAVTAQTIAAIDYPALTEVIAEQLKAINIDVTVQPLEIGIFGKNNAEGTFDWQVTGRGMRGDPSGYLADFDPSRGTYKAWFEGGGWKSDEMTSLITEGLAEADPVKRHELYTRMQEIAMTEFPTIPLVAPLQFQAVRNRVQDMKIDIGGTMRYLRSAWVTE